MTTTAPTPPDTAPAAAAATPSAAPPSAWLVCWRAAAASAAAAASPASPPPPPGLNRLSIPAIISCDPYKGVHRTQQSSGVLVRAHRFRRKLTINALNKLSGCIGSHGSPVFSTQELCQRYAAC